MEAPTRTFECHECSTPILDVHVMVISGFYYHECCLQCSECGEAFDETNTCFQLNGKLLCKEDYQKMFTKCWICDEEFQPEDFVIRSSSNIFHLDCFQCHTCDEQVETSKNYLYAEKKIFCEKHHKDSTSSSSKPPRGRTVFTESQLHTLRSYYLVNPRPDATAKEQLIRMTNLGPKVVRTWFQNQRCKDKITNARRHN